MSKGSTSQALQGGRCHSLSSWKFKRKKKKKPGREERNQSSYNVLFYKSSFKQTKNYETCKGKRDPYLGKHSTKQNRSNQCKRKQSIHNGSLWVQLLDTSDKGFKAATLNTFKKKETVLRKLKENTMKMIQKTENRNSDTQTNKNVKFGHEKYTTLKTIHLKSLTAHFWDNKWKNQ